MKRKQTFNLAQTAMLLLVMLCSMGAWAEKKIVVFSDPHVMSPDLLLSGGGPAWTNYLEGQRKMLDHSKQLFDEMIAKLKTDQPNLVLIPGDLTKDGEQASHECVISKLDELRALGIKVLVIPGNHDHGSNANAVCYHGNIDEITTVDVADNDWFATKYANYGYNASSERYGTSLTYACEPLEGLVVIGIDSGTDGTVSSETLSWITTKAAAAQENGKRVIAMMHHPLIPHFTGADTFVETAVVANYETVRNALADAGINVVFTGHFHTSDIAKDWNADMSKEIYDVNTGSLISYPCDYREVTMSDNFLEMSITTGHITTLQGIDDFPNYAKGRLQTGMKNVVTAKGYGAIATKAADAFIIHAEGNEQDNENSATMISTFESVANGAAILGAITSKQATALKTMVNSMLQDKSNYCTNRENVTNDLTLNLPRSLATCDVTMPDQTLEGPNNPFVNISYKFEYANNNFNESSAQDFIAEMGIVVKEGANTMRLGIDYYFGSVELADGNPIGEKSNLGDKCKVEIVGKGEYTGSKWVEFMVTTPDVSGTWSTLAWTFHAGTLNITGIDAMDSANQGRYPWFSIENYIKTIIIGEGITRIANYAFAGTSNMHSYGNLTTVSLPSTLETIGDYAFAYSGLTSINIPANVTSIGDDAFDQCGSLESITLNGEIIIGLSAFPSNAFVTIADGLTLHNGYEVLSGFINDISKLNLRALTLPTYNVTANQDPAHAGEYWSTFYHPAASYQVGANEKAYIGRVSGNSVTLTQITDGFIPKGTAVVLKAISDNFSLSRTEDDAFKNYDDENDLRGGDQEDFYNNVYTLAAWNNVVGFYKFTGAELNPNKAHLEIAPSSTREFYGFDIDDSDSEDGIKSIDNGQLIIDNEAIYNLSGQKLNKPQKGINIVNGKKILF